MNVVTVEDINYLAQQSSGRINMILSGMTALMNDTDNKAAAMESQNWFQRMVRTVSGKNKMTKIEIQQNHEKLNAYMSEAIAELYNRNCIDHEVMMSLGTQLNELYADHLQLKQMLGAFVGKLNEKIDSVDNFHMLVTEINQGVYSGKTAIVSICNVLSQFDHRIIGDGRKLDIIKRGLLEQNIVNDDEILLSDYLLSITEIPMEEAGKIYLELGTIRGNFMADIILGMMESYHFLPDMARKMKNKKMLIEEVIKSEGLDDTITLSINEIYDDFINSKIDVKNGLIPIAGLQADSALDEAEQLYFNCKLDEAFEQFRALAEKGNARAMYFLGEFYVQPYGHIAKDNEEGTKWRKMGYELGDTLASLNVAYCLPRDSEERKYIFDTMFAPTLQLAESGDIYAQNELSDLYFSGYGVAQNGEEGFKWLKKSAEAGFWRSIDKIGDLYYNGTYVKQDYNEAMRWYKKGAEIGYAKSYLNLAYCYYYGNGTDENNDKALELLKKAYSLGNAEAANMIGIMYNKGYGVPIDEDQEFLWIKRSADLGYTQGQSNLGNCYYCGRGTDQNYELAKEYYKKASDGGYNYATTQLGIIAMEDNDYIEAVKWFRMAAENGYDDAQNRLGCRYDNGQGVSEDKEEAFKWFMKSAEQGNMKAQANVGKYYHEGIVVEQNDELAKEWLRKSSEQGWETADIWLNEFYGEGSKSRKNSSKNITSDTYETIKSSCELFKLMHNEARFDPTYKLKATLGVLYEDVYLAHDDTIFNTGKNGFAITENGIYCRGLFESYTSFVSFEELSKADSIDVRDGDVYADGKKLAYITGSDEEKKDLKELFEQIALFVKIDLW